MSGLKIRTGRMSSGNLAENSETKRIFLGRKGKPNSSVIRNEVPYNMGTRKKSREARKIICR